MNKINGRPIKAVLNNAKVVKLDEGKKTATLCVSPKDAAALHEACREGSLFLRPKP